MAPLPAHCLQQRRRRRWSAALALLVALSGCADDADRSARLVVGTFWGGTAAEALNRELILLADRLGPVEIEVRTFTFEGLADQLSRSRLPTPSDRLDLFVVPNDWLGQVAERGGIAELSVARGEAMQRRLVGQALLAVTDRDKVLAFPVSAELLALVYDPSRFPSPPQTMEDVLAAGRPGVRPFAIALGSSYHMAPLVSAFQGMLVDVDGRFVWRPDVLAGVVQRLAPVWQDPDGWRMCTGADLESLQLQLFAEGRLAAFLAGPWLLEALEQCGRPFAVAPIPPFADSPYPARALVGYQCLAVSSESRWVDLALDLGTRLLDAEVNERLNRATRRLPVLAESYRPERALTSPGAVGFLRALEQGQFFPASAEWSEDFRNAGGGLERLGRRRQPPSVEQAAAILTRGQP